METHTLKSLFACFLLALLESCSGGPSTQEPVPMPPTPGPSVTEKIPILLSCDIAPASTVSTRVSDTGFDTNDRIGLYVVNYNGNTAGILQQTGNHVDNMSFTYNGSWTPATPIYWKDDQTKADFYCYYPYTNVSSITAHAVSVNADQSSTAAYKSSEFIYGKATNIAPTSKAVGITAKHLMSCALIKIAAGNGFTTESIAAAEVSVKLNEVKLNATANLQEGTLTATGEAASITPLKEGDQYKALVVPQSVNSTKFITVNVNGREYKLAKEFTFIGGKRHTFTVTVSKTSNGVNVNISQWEDDGVDNGGTAE